MGFLVAGLSLAALASVALAQGPATLRPAIAARYPNVDWVTTRTLARWLEDPAEPAPVLLDARERAEYRVSHLKGARRVDPDRSDLSSLRLPRDHRIVVYCSVGWRSGAIADRLHEAGYERVYNLEGGIFAWANEGRPLYRGRERVTRVHPYDATWGRLLDEERRAPIDD